MLPHFVLLPQLPHFVTCLSLEVLLFFLFSVPLVLILFFLYHFEKFSISNFLSPPVWSPYPLSIILYIYSSILAAFLSFIELITSVLVFVVELYLNVKYIRSVLQSREIFGTFKIFWNQIRESYCISSICLL